MHIIRLIFGANFVYNAGTSRIKISNNANGTHYVAATSSNDVNNWKWGTTGTAGGGEAHTHGDTGTSSKTTIDITNKYITAYMWKRTA